MVGPRAARLGDAEVGQHRAARLVVDQDVVGLDVAVDDALAVRVVERLREVGQQPPGRVRGELPSRAGAPASDSPRT